MTEPINLNEPMPKEGLLSEDQQRRALTLAIAKPLLTGNSFGSKPPPSVEDLILLASWICDGMEEEDFPYLHTDGIVQLGPDVIMRPDGYVEISGERYQSVGTEDS